MSDRRLGRALGVSSVLLELPLVVELFFLDTELALGWLFFLAICAPAVALAGLALSAGKRDWLGVAVASVGLGGVVVPAVLVWAITSAFQQG